MSGTQKIAELFTQVFTPEGSIRHHSKAACKELIFMLQLQQPFVYFGDVSTGRMYVTAVLKYGREHGFIQDH